MANVTANTGTYAGKLALPYVYPALMAADTIVNNWCDVRPNVVGKAALRKWSGSSITDRTCGFTGQAGTLSEVILATTSVEIKLELCHADLVATWEADLMRNGRTAPQDTKAAMLTYLAKQAAEDVEKNMWRGDYNSTSGATTGGGATSAFNSWSAKIVSGTPGSEDLLTGATVASSAAATGILPRLDGLLNGAPSVLFGDDNAYLYMSPYMKQLYYQAMAATHGPVLAEMVNSYAGIKIVTPRGMPNDLIVFSRWDNFVFGTDLTGNNFETAAGVVDLNETTLEDVVRGMIAFSAGCQVVDLGSLAVARRTS
jgi:hypothetical protein